MTGEILLAIWLASFAVVYLAVRFAPFGWQDCNGFHLGEPVLEGDV